MGLANRLSSAEAQGALEEYQNRSLLGQKVRFQSVLERLLRLRQMYAKPSTNIYR
jgi:hypothetical protein